MQCFVRNSALVHLHRGGAAHLTWFLEMPWHSRREAPYPLVVTSHLLQSTCPLVALCWSPSWRDALAGPCCRRDSGMRAFAKCRDGVLSWNGCSICCVGVVPVQSCV